MPSGNHPVDPVDASEPTYESWLSIARTLTVAGRFDEALAACQQAITLAPGVIDAYCEKGFILSHNWWGREEAPEPAYEQGLALCEEALLREPAQISLWEKKGDILCSLNREAEALATYEALVRLAPHEPGSY